jgi:hypothetical protein
MWFESSATRTVSTLGRTIAVRPSELVWVTVPELIENWVRVGMLVLALTAPLGAGYVAGICATSGPGAWG